MARAKKVLKIAIATHKLDEALAKENKTGATQITKAEARVAAEEARIEIRRAKGLRKTKKKKGISGILETRII